MVRSKYQDQTGQLLRSSSQRSPGACAEAKEKKLNESGNHEARKTQTQARWLRKWLRRSAVLVAVVLIGLGVAGRRQIVYFAGSGFTLPAPDGPYAVGRLTWNVDGQGRKEILTEDPNDTRVIRVDVYYPAVADNESARGIYMDRRIVEAATGLPPWAIAPIHVNWQPAAKPQREGGPYPVLLFSPGLDSPPAFYTSLLEHLASRGYIVLALWHPHTTASMLLNDGRIIESSYAGNDAMYEGTDEEQNSARQRVTRLWAEDSVVALDEAVRRNANDQLLEGMFDLTRVGAFGHSFGGQNAAAAMTLDVRILAGLNMDGTAIFQNIFDEGVTGAFAFVYDHFGPPREYLERSGKTEQEWWDEWTERNCAGAIRENASECYIFQIDGVAHEGFASDLTLLRPIFPFAVTEEMVGTIDGLTVLMVETDLIAGFFDKTLSGQDSPILEDPTALHPMLHRGIKDHPTLADH